MNYEDISQVPHDLFLELDKLFDTIQTLKKIGLDKSAILQEVKQCF